MNRGLMVEKSLASLTKRSLTVDEQVDARLVGWCIEILQALFLVADDIMDNSTTRRGQPCWYRVKGLIACNDYLLLEGVIYRVLRKRFRGTRKAMYHALTDLFLGVTWKTVLGQLVDTLTALQIKSIDEFTVDRVSLIAKYKTAFYSFYLPVRASMVLSGVGWNMDDEHDEGGRVTSASGTAEKPLVAMVESVLVHMGIYFQAQDDYLDVFATEEVLGKRGTDISDMKCSWVAAKAVTESSASEEQLLTLRDNYGKGMHLPDETIVAHEEKVRDVFRQLNIEKVYKEYEDASLKAIRESIVAYVIASFFFFLFFVCVSIKVRLISFALYGADSIVPWLMI